MARQKDPHLTACAVWAMSLIATTVLFGSLLRDRPGCYPKTDSDIIAIVSAVEHFQLGEGHLPPRLVDLTKRASRGRRYLSSDDVPRDPWGREYVYRPMPFGLFEIATYGKDGKVGGRGENADLTSTMIFGRLR